MGFPHLSQKYLHPAKVPNRHPIGSHRNAASGFAIYLAHGRIKSLQLPAAVSSLFTATVAPAFYGVPQFKSVGHQFPPPVSIVMPEGMDHQFPVTCYLAYRL